MRLLSFCVAFESSTRSELSVLLFRPFCLTSFYAAHPPHGLGGVLRRARIDPQSAEASCAVPSLGVASLVSLICRSKAPYVILGRRC